MPKTDRTEDFSKQDEKILSKKEWIEKIEKEKQVKLKQVKEQTQVNK